MNDLISIVVPIYNVEQYLDNCVSCILNQTYTNLEIILVDDGSPDQCGTMCDSYAERDSRVRVIHKKNGGLSDARNVGISAANGKYITCIDSDDYVSSDFIEYLYRLAENYNAEISICGFIKTASLTETQQLDNGNVFIYNAEEALMQMLYAQVFTTSAWGKLYKRELFNGIEYPVGKYSEDMFTTYKLISKSTKIVCGNRVCYYYVFRPGSILNRGFSLKHLDVIDAVRLIKDEGHIKTTSQLKAYKSQMVSSMAEMLEKNPPKNSKVDDVWSETKGYLIDVAMDKMASKRVRAFAVLMLLGRRISSNIIIKYYSMKWR